MTNKSNVTSSDPTVAPILTLVNNKPVTTSAVVAEHFNKRHDNVLRSIAKLDCSKEFNALNFESVEYLDSKGEKRPAYQMTKDGFVFLCMGFTGKEAAKWKEAYIEAFNKMEAELNKPAPQTLTPAQKNHIQKVVSHRVEVLNKPYQTIYRSIKDQFKVATYSEIPSSQYPSLCEFLGTQPLEGELMSRGDLPSIDVEHLMLDHLNGMNFEYSEKVMIAIQEKSVELSIEAFSIIKDHVEKRVHYHSGKSSDKKKLRIIDEISLGNALAHKYSHEINSTKSFFDTLVSITLSKQSEMAEAIKQYENKPSLKLA